MMKSRLRVRLPALFTLMGLLWLHRPVEAARVFTIVNSCGHLIWPAITPGGNFDGGGFVLKPGQAVVLTAPVGWSGRIWARTGCKFDKSGNGTCLTGGCGTALKCAGSGKPPASLAEFTLAALDFYDVSLVDGFNLPVVVTPVNSSCSVAGCDRDLRGICPKELAVRAHGTTVACRSACDVFNTDEFCCRGVYGNAATCQPTYYSKTFKDACPAAYSYAYDDPSSIVTCSSTDYIVNFCATNRTQRMCTYHDGQLKCRGSNSSWLNGPRWIILITFIILSTLCF